MIPPAGEHGLNNGLVPANRSRRPPQGDVDNRIRLIALDLT